MLVAMDPVFVCIWFHLFKFEAGEGMERKVMPIFSVHPQVSDEQTLCSARQVEDSNRVVYFGGAEWIDRALNAKVVSDWSKMKNLVTGTSAKE